MRMLSILMGRKRSRWGGDRGDLRVVLLCRLGKERCGRRTGDGDQHAHLDGTRRKLL
jgi:hypothetical protein